MPTALRGNNAETLPPLCVRAGTGVATGIQGVGGFANGRAAGRACRLDGASYRASYRHTAGAFTTCPGPCIDRVPVEPFLAGTVGSSRGWWTALKFCGRRKTPTSRLGSEEGWSRHARTSTPRLSRVVCSRQNHNIQRVEPMRLLSHKRASPASPQFPTRLALPQLQGTRIEFGTCRRCERGTPAASNLHFQIVRNATRRPVARQRTLAPLLSMMSQVVVV